MGELVFNYAYPKSEEIEGREMTDEKKSGLDVSKSVNAKRYALNEDCICGHPRDEFHEFGSGRCGSSECVGACERFTPKSDTIDDRRLAAAKDYAHHYNGEEDAFITGALWEREQLSRNDYLLGQVVNEVRELRKPLGGPEHMPFCSGWNAALSSAEDAIRKVIPPTRPVLKEAVSVLVHALETDPGYRISWKANIAMAFADQFLRSYGTENYHGADGIHAIANNAADYFLEQLCKDRTEETQHIDSKGDK